MTTQKSNIEILLVEDNPTDAELCIMALQEHNFANKLVWVKDGAEALDFIFSTGEYAGRNMKNTPKVILLDLRLPKVDGFEVLRRLKEDKLTKQIPVVIMTSSKEERDIATSYELGANSYITKPIEFNEFSKVVANLGMYWLLVNHPPIIRL